MVLRKQSSYECNFFVEILFQNSYIRYNSTEQQTGPSDGHCIAMPADVHGCTHCADETNNFSLADNPHFLRHGNIDRFPTTYFSAVPFSSCDIRFTKISLTIAKVGLTRFFAAP